MFASQRPYRPGTKSQSNIISTTSHITATQYQPKQQVLVPLTCASHAINPAPLWP